MRSEIHGNLCHRISMTIDMATFVVDKYTKTWNAKTEDWGISYMNKINHPTPVLNCITFAAPNGRAEDFVKYKPLKSYTNRASYYHKK